MYKTFLAISAFAVITWNLVDISQAQEVKTAEFTSDNYTIIVQEAHWRLYDCPSGPCWKYRPSHGGY